MWKLQVAAIILLILASAFWLCDPLVLKWIVDSCLPSHKLGLLATAAALLAIVHLSRIATLCGSLYMSSKSGQNLAESLRLELFRDANYLPAHSLEDSRVGDIVYSLEQDVDQVVGLGSDVLPTLARVSLITVLSVVIMFKLDARLTLITSTLAPVFVLLGWYSRTALKKFAEHSREAAQERSGFCSEAITGSIQIRILRAFGQVYELYQKRVCLGSTTTLAERCRQLVYSGSSLGIIAIASTIMLGVGGATVIGGGLTVGSYIAFYTYLLRLFEPLNTAVDLFAKVQRSGVSIARLQSLSEKSAGVAVSQSMAIEAMPDDRASQIRSYRFPCETFTFCDLSFRYSRENVAFKHVSFEIRKGERLLVDGASGAGKSTLLKVIASVYPDYEGDILLDGVKIDPGMDIGFCVGFVTQHPVLFSASVRDNLLLGSPGSSVSSIEEALYLSCADSLVSNLPRGLEHIIGQSGAGLSGGERQRIALARTILQKRPILLLDEATSGLDSSMKSVLFARLEQFTRERITILVSHDPLCKAWADRYISLSSRQEVDTEAAEDLSAAFAELTYGQVLVARQNQG